LICEPRYATRAASGNAIEFQGRFVDPAVADGETPVACRGCIDGLESGTDQIRTRRPRGAATALAENRPHRGV